MKKTWKLPTVWVALAAAALAVVSIYMPWFSKFNQSASLQKLIEVEEEMAPLLIVIYIGLAWSAAFFLLNLPKLTIIGSLAALGCGGLMLMAITDIGYEVCSGLYLYMVAVIVMLIMAFATKKIRVPKAEAEKVLAGYDPNTGAPIYK